MNSKLLFNYIKMQSYYDHDLEYIENYLDLTFQQLVRSSFKLLNSLIDSNQIIINSTYLNDIDSCINFICYLFKNDKITEKEIEINKERIKKSKMALIANANKYNNDVLIKCASKLDKISLDKFINLDNLKKIVINLIDKKEDTNIIKKFISTNKGELLINTGELFDYTFKLAIKSLNINDRDIYYYICLLKMFYTKNINKDKYIKMLNIVSNDSNSFANEIYLILFNDRDALSEEEILDKYGIITKLQDKKIIIPKSISNCDECIITIDDENTMLRDDALSIKKDGNNFIVGIHILDAGKFIKPNSKIDIDALNNYKCLYCTEDNNLRIFSNEIENELSLNEKNNRNCISLYIIFNENADIIDYFFKEENILIRNNLSYTQTDSIIECGFHDYNFLKDLYNLAFILENKNKKKKDYWKNKTIPNNPLDSKSNTIVREFMVLYNYLIASFAKENNIPYIYRVQEKSYLKDLISELNIDKDDEISQIANNTYLYSKYSTIAMPHSGLNLDVYSHSTDSARRYPDLYNQYLFHKFYFKDKEFEFNEDNFKLLVEYFNQRTTELHLMKSELIKVRKPK